MRRSILSALSLTVAGSALVFFTGSGCGGGGGSSTKPAATPTAESSGTEPKVVIEDSTEVWYEEESGKPGEKGTGIREYVLDVTKVVEIKGSSVNPSGSSTTKIYRVAVRFPVPKVQPPDARDVHTVNRLLWDVRKEMAKCYYKGPGKEPGAELSMVGWLSVNKKGEVTKSGVEKSDEAMKAAGGFEDCVMENVKGLVFSAAGDDVKIRFKLKFQTADVTGNADVKAPPPAKKKE